MPGSPEVQNPERDVRPPWLDKSSIDRNSEAQAGAARVAGAVSQARGRRRASRFAKIDDLNPEREKAQGSIRPSVGLNPRRIARDSRKAVPGSRALSRVSRRFSNRWPWAQAATASGAGRAGNACWTFREEKASKGEPERRCRPETKPTRQSREQAVERVTKPCGRKVSGDGFARVNRTSVAACAIRD
jgi:hypothetical protein